MTRGDTNTDHSVAKAALGGTAIASGLGVIREQFQRGNLTGRETLYHGTSPERAKSILEHGLLPNNSIGPRNITGKVRNKIGVRPRGDNFLRNTRGLVYAAKHPGLAGMYPDYIKAIDGKRPEMMASAVSSPRVHEARANRSLKESLRHAIGLNPSGEDIVKINAPTWMKDKFHQVRDPEILGLGKTWQWKNPDTKKNSWSGKISRNILLKLHRDKNFVNKGNIGTEYIPGSKNYQGNSVGEILSYIKNNPGRFAKGVGVATLGTGAVAAGVQAIRKRNEEWY